MTDPHGPLVSVVTPCLDPGDRLRRCIDSVAAQTYPHVEHVVVDGGSHDGTPEILAGRSEVRWVSEPDAGQAAAINKGFAMATGDLLTWLNADDALTPRAAERAAEAVRRDPVVGWVYGNLEIREGGRSRIRRPPRTLRREAFRMGNPVPQPGTFFTRKALERVGGLDESLTLAMDFDLWLRFLDAGVRAAHVPETQAIFEIHPGSKTGSTDAAEFLREMAIAHLKHGRAEDARMTLERWLWRRAYSEVAEALRDRRWRDARRAASRAEGLVAPPGILRARTFLRMARLTPRLARSALRARRDLDRPAPDDGDPDVR